MQIKIKTQFDSQIHFNFEEEKLEFVLKSSSSMGIYKIVYTYLYFNILSYPPKSFNNFKSFFRLKRNLNFC